MSQLLIVREKSALRNLLNNALEAEHTLEFWPNKDNIFGKPERINYDLIVINVELTNVNGMKLLESIKSITPTTPVQLLAFPYLVGLFYDIY